MDTERDSLMPLLVGCVVAVLIHAIGLPILLVALAGQTAWPAGPIAEMDQALPSAAEIMLGSNDTPISTVAWISHPDFQELIAPQSSTEQPAQQQSADPVAQAPLLLDATPPAPSAQALGTVAAEAVMIVMDPADQARRLPLRLPQPTTDSQLPFALTTDFQQQGTTVLVDATGEAQKANSGATPAQARPTASPRTDSETEAAQIDPPDKPLQPGGVLTHDGITITTVVPRLSAITRASTWPSNPVAQITFATDGVVTEVKLLESSGAETVDTPVIASLYKWRASGEKLKERDTPLTITITIILTSR